MQYLDLAFRYIGGNDRLRVNYLKLSMKLANMYNDVGGQLYINLCSTGILVMKLGRAQKTDHIRLDTVLVTINFFLIRISINVSGTRVKYLLSAPNDSH